MMTDPVMDTDGNTFERVAIERWLNLEDSHGLSPLTKKPITIVGLVANRALRNLIIDWKNVNGEYEE